MGCFLACLGVSNKRKRRRLSNRVAAAGGDHFLLQRRGSYIQLDSALTIVGLDGPKESPKSTGSEQLREKTKEGTTSFKIRKKVSFNLNVQTYEPISTDYQYVESEEEEEEREKNHKEVSRGSLSASAAKRASTALRAIGLYPSNHRYQNVRDSYGSYEEEDYAAEDEDSEFDDDDYYGDDDYCEGESDMDDQRLSQEGFPKLFSSSINGELESCRWNLNTGDNIPLTHSVLSPIENLSQWKAAKAKAAAPKHQKENISPFQEPKILYNRSGCNPSKPLLQEIPVHTSLSSWIRSK